MNTSYLDCKTCHENSLQKALNKVVTKKFTLCQSCLDAINSYGSSTSQIIEQFACQSQKQKFSIDFTILKDADAFIVVVNDNHNIGGHYQSLKEAKEATQLLMNSFNSGMFYGL